MKVFDLMKAGQAMTEGQTLLHFAEVDKVTNICTGRVLVAESLEKMQMLQPESMWVETKRDDAVERPAAVGLIYVPGDLRKFLTAEELHA